MDEKLDPVKLRETQEAMANLVQDIQKHLPEGFGFFILVTKFGAGNRSNYASNMDRVGAMNTMKEFILNNNGTEEEWMKHIS